MSGVAVIRYLLANNAPLIAAVPASKIMAGVVPLNVTLPAISIRQISGVEVANIKRGSNEMVTDRVQVSGLASTYLSQKSILELIRSALPGTRGTINGFAVDSIIPESDGPDLYSEAPITYEQSIDYMVRYIR